ncbi:MAG: hypothetical protein AB7T31_05780 [Gemmatimonadales bacterium]
MIPTCRLSLPVACVALCALAACTSAPPRAGSAPTLTTVFVVPPADRTPRGIELRHEATVGERTVSGTVSEVWAVLPAIFEQLEIETTTVDPAQGVIGNSGYRARRVEGRRLSDYMDCGRSFGREYADQYTVTLAVLVQLVTAADGRTVVRTILDGYARDPSTSGSSVHCITWGSLERRIGDLVVERLGT